MTENQFVGGVWPVMLTPFTHDNQVDTYALAQLVEWYISKGVSGLFSVCQSSEMFFLSLSERELIARTVVQTAAGRVPVIASGHISDDIMAQAEELNVIAETGVSAVVMITNRLAKEDESDAVWLQRLESLLPRINPHIPLGFYECPYPYKRLLNPALIQRMLSFNRFNFIKDTCCDFEQLLQKQALVAGSSLKIYNANTATLLKSLRAGITGFSGVMANFHPELYVWLCQHIDAPEAEPLQEFLTTAALIERQIYPVNAKYALQTEGLPVQTYTRTKDETLLNEVAKSEVRQLMRLSKRVFERLPK